MPMVWFKVAFSLIHVASEMASGRSLAQNDATDVTGHVKRFWLVPPTTDDRGTGTLTLAVAQKPAYELKDKAPDDDDDTKYRFKEYDRLHELYLIAQSSFGGDQSHIKVVSAVSGEVYDFRGTDLFMSPDRSMVLVTCYAEEFASCPVNGLEVWRLNFGEAFLEFSLDTDWAPVLPRWVNLNSVELKQVRGGENESAWTYGRACLHRSGAQWLLQPLYQPLVVRRIYREPDSLADKLGLTTLIDEIAPHESCPSL